MNIILKKKYGIFLVLFILLIGGIVLFALKKLQPEKKVHYHAGFAIFRDNKKLSFSDFKYMYEKPCTLNGKDNEANENDQLEKAHLHDNVGDVVHIERDGAKWRDLFINIHYPIDYSTTKGYINGKEVKNYESQPIKSQDILVVFEGNNDFNKDLQQAPTEAYVEEMGKKSKTCGD